MEVHHHVKQEDQKEKVELNLERKSPEHPLGGALPRLTSPLNLSPNPPELDGERRIPPKIPPPLPNRAASRESPTNSAFHCPTPPNSWTR